MTTDRPHVEHLYQRPGWECRVCHRPWPCTDAKYDLLAEYRSVPSALVIYLACQMYDALDDLTAHGGPAPPELDERFLGWARQARATLLTSQQLP